MPEGNREQRYEAKKFTMTATMMGKWHSWSASRHPVGSVDQCPFCVFLAGRASWDGVVEVVRAAGVHVLRYGHRFVEIEPSQSNRDRLYALVSGRTVACPVSTPSEDV